MYLNAKDQIDFRLVIKATSDECGETEKFEVHFGDKNIVSLKSRVNQKFLGASNENNIPMAFDQNQFTSLEIEKVFDKSHFPRVS